MGSPRPKVNKYEGGNPTMDRLLAEYWPDDTVWMVNGAVGRKPIVAETEKEALEIYERRREEDSSDVVREAS